MFNVFRVKAFQVKASKSIILVSPGLNITTYVSYSFKSTSMLHAIIPIEINGKIFDYCVISALATEYITVEPKSLDFGTIDIGYSSDLKSITIRNEGSKSTRYSRLFMNISRTSEIKLQCILFLSLSWKSIFTRIFLYFGFSSILYHTKMT